MLLLDDCGGNSHSLSGRRLVMGRGSGLWLGSYRILDRLGKGGMSQVYLAEHSVLRKRVAVKVLSACLRADQVARRRFVRETRAAAAIDHPNIVHVFDVDINHDPPYLVMEFVDGVSLRPPSPAMERLLMAKRQWWAPKSQGAWLLPPPRDLCIAISSLQTCCSIAAGE